MDGISGTLLWNDLKEFNTQLNDPVEQLYKKLIKQIQKLFPDLHMGYLESCGCAALANCMSVTKQGREIQREICKTKGIYNSQASHIYIGYLNDPSNYPKLEQARIASGAPKIGAANIQGNRVPQYYYCVALDVLGINSDFKWRSSFDELKNIVTSGNPIQVCKINPGHYIAVKAYDRIKDELIYDDSWLGPNKRLTRQDVKINIQNFRIRYFVK
jgi:hypothetical protein